MKRMEINGGGWRWMKRMEMNEEYEDEWVRLRLELGLGFRDRV